MTTHTERIKACLRGETPDRSPVALWRHFPMDDQSPEALAAATLNFQRTYDFDLVKVTPASSFCLRDWGAEDEWRGHTEGTRDYTGRVITNPSDWETLPMLDAGAPHLAAQLACLRIIRAELGRDVPVIQTIFSPLAQAKNLAGNERLIAHIRLFPETLMHGLKTIAETTTRFVEAALETGIDGVFYAVQHAQAHMLSLDEYKVFGLPYDHYVMSAAREAWCNMLHLHGLNVYFEIASQLPVQIVNWHDRETPPSLSQGMEGFRGVVCGGLRQDTLVFQDHTAVMREAEEALRQTSGRNFILSTGCVVPVIAPHGSYLAARRSMEPSFGAGR